MPQAHTAVREGNHLLETRVDGVDEVVAVDPRFLDLDPEDMLIQYGPPAGPDKAAKRRARRARP
jgi:hypothetical protein